MLKLTLICGLRKSGPSCSPTRPPLLELAGEEALERKEKECGDGESPGRGGDEKKKKKMKGKPKIN